MPPPEVRSLEKQAAVGPYLTMRRVEERQALRGKKKTIVAAARVVGHIFQPQHIAALVIVSGETASKLLGLIKIIKTDLLRQREEQGCSFRADSLAVGHEG